MRWRQRRFGWFWLFTDFEQAPLGRTKRGVCLQRVSPIFDRTLPIAQLEVRSAKLTEDRWFVGVQYQALLKQGQRCFWLLQAQVSGGEIV